MRAFYLLAVILAVSLMPVAVRAEGDAGKAAKDAGSQQDGLLGKQQASTDLLAQGVASPDRVWSGREYLALSKLLEAGSVVLPKKDSAETGKFFARIINPENLALLATPNVPIGNRLNEVVELSKGSSSIVLSYVRGVQTDRALESELAYLQAFLLTLARHSVANMTEFLGTVPPEQMTEARKQGVQQFNSGIKQTLFGVTMSVGERDLYSEDSVAVLLRSITENYGGLRSVLTDADKQDLRASLQKLADNEKSEGSRKAVQETMKALD